MSDIRDLISANEMDMITAYRKENASGCGEFMPSYELLHPWSVAKAGLCDLFDNHLILSKQIQLDRTEDCMKHEMSEAYEYGGFSQFFEKIFWALRKINAPSDVYIAIRDSTSYANLVKNIYTGPNATIINPDDPSRKYKISNGCKIMKMFKGLTLLFEGMKVPFYWVNNDVISMEEYEKVRIAHSQVLNQKKLTGELCLSIHPLDFMTMSDNESGWSSCMSWREEGCYRHGTVEMMNSGNVIVAYLKGSNNMTIDGQYWNNKKWRELFIVEDNFIMEVKPYPYCNDELTKTCLSWLKELVEKNWHISYEDTLCARDSDYGKVFLEGYMDIDTKISVNPRTNWMYNDFGALSKNLCYFSKDILEKAKDNEVYCEPNYSGVSQCMWCGETNIDLDYVDDANSLICERCDDTINVYYCENCDCRIYDDEALWVGGSCYCESCYDDLFCECDICQTIVHRESANPFILLDPEELDISIDEDNPDIVSVSSKHTRYSDCTNKFYVCRHCQSQNSLENKKGDVLVLGKLLNHLYRVEHSDSYYGFFKSDIIDKGKNSWGNPINPLAAQYCNESYTFWNTEGFKKIY